MDKRIEKTKKKLKKALLSLLEKKTISAITVSELCTAANVNRNTFYTHYLIPNDLLKEISDTLIGSFQKTLADSNLDRKSTINKLTVIFDFAKEHQKMFSILLSDNCENLFVAQLKTVTIALMIDRHYPNQYNSFIHYDVEFNFYGTINVLKQWIDTGCSQETCSMAAFIYSICNHDEAMKKYR